MILESQAGYTACTSLAAVPKTPLATYRVQLRPELGFADAAAIAPYLAALGVSHLYSSPYLQAAKGSSHGYDVIDPTRVNGDLGGEEAHSRFCRVLAAQGLGQILDVVPNHMAITDRRNVWWWSSPGSCCAWPDAGRTRCSLSPPAAGEMS